MFPSQTGYDRVQNFEVYSTDFSNRLGNFSWSLGELRPVISQTQLVHLQ